MRKPFYFAQKKCWYVKDASGKPIRLDPDEETAYGIWQRMQAAKTSLVHPKAPLAAIVAAWIAEHEPLIGKDNFDTIEKRLAVFVKHAGTTAATDVSPATAMRCVGKLAKCGSSSRRHHLSALKRVFRWAHERGYIPLNPVASLRLPEPDHRERVIETHEHAAMVERSRQTRNGKEFALYLIASHCGARPQQIRTVTAKHVHRSGKAWVFREHKSVEKTKKPLTVYLSPCLQTLTRILVEARKTGPLFVQESGKPWKKDTVSQRFRRMCEHLKIENAVAYSYRHTFATDLLTENVPIATVSHLLGHVDTRMVSKVYGHLDQVSSHLVDAAAKATQKRLSQ